MMQPQISIGVLSQKSWRGLGTGPLDDCWLCTDLFCVHAVTPWNTLYNGVQFRAAAGVPDTNTGIEGGSLEASLKAIQKLWPTLGAKVWLYRDTFANLAPQVKAGHIIDASVLSNSLPINYGFTGTKSNHRVTFWWDGTTYRIANPLAPAYHYLDPITEAQVKKALVDYPDAAEANCLIFPTVEEAFKLHPLYVPATDPKVSFNAGVDAASSAALKAKQ